MSSPAVAPLLYSARPWSDESVLNSFQLRLRELNRIGSFRQLDQILGQRAGTTTALRLLIDPTQATAIGRLSNLSFDLAEDVPQPLTSATAGSKNSHVLRWRRGQLSIQFWMHEFAQVCPECLTEKGYLDDSLDYWHVPVCWGHGRVLLDACPRCRKRLDFDRPALCHCGECGADLRPASMPAVGQAVCATARALTALLPMNIVAAEETVELQPSQVAALVAHFASGEYVQSISSDLPTGARGLSAELRLTGLKTLAGCIVGRDIDARLLREALIQRTRYLEPFRGTKFFDWWLLDGLDGTDLGIRASNAIAYGRVDDVSHLEVHKTREAGFGAGSKSELRKLLGTTVYEVDELVRCTGLTKEPEAVGYDAEELAGAITFYRACLSEPELDACFGLNGLTGKLLSHGKVQEFASRATSPRRVTPDSLNTFLAGLERDVPWSEVSVDTLTVSDCAADDDEPVRLAANLLMGAGMPVARFSGWAPPFRLADVLLQRGSPLDRQDSDGSN